MQTSVLNSARVWRRSLRGALQVTIISLTSITIFPFFWSIVLSSHNRESIFSSVIPMYWGDFFQENYRTLVELVPYWTAMYNSIVISVLGTFVSLLFCSMAGYAFALQKFKLKKLLFSFMIATMMVPPVVSLVPYYLTIQFLGLLNTHLAVWLPFTAAPVGIFLVRQFIIRSVPPDLIEAAKLDGASDLDVFFRVVLPLIKPALATLGIIQFVFFWNNFLTPLVVLSEQDKLVLPLALRSLQNHPNAPWGAVMVGTTLAFIPVLIVYFFFSRKIIAGLTSGAVKG
ncbi:carbohydrate ABC transporter permease [Pseudobacteriovorax antillogorgiicola]|uniref:sn-glycerol-3-phosphate transport system permease protein UgpE n=1 Tax=Pseudobacteriovorax antillogorgiicola TaxID=1513793 RepID=A0A1Y6BDG6_9BACT|nr:carbohydrate ABC transporter permease [Pseudobacteriovorax antillogorgiicola]TCS57354.1 carbohydrate ABC transporter membrane protein 2 (CUT1 family) [Pseudobacteriovorax antillogorgiicola]SMF02071.1 carbohydrate ABC transporter membrane protein 2, CUT1 family [Pseudobacteriovorax antillogorgiicola]